MASNAFARRSIGASQLFMWGCPELLYSSGQSSSTSTSVHSGFLGQLLAFGSGAAKVSRPRRMQTPVSMQSVAFGSHHAAMLGCDGRVYVYGKNKHFELGLGSNEDCAQPTCVPGLRDIKQVLVGQKHGIALDQDGHVWTWGCGKPSMFGRGALGHGNWEDQPTPKMVEGLRGVKIIEISAGAYHNLALSENNQVYAFGRGENGRLGNGKSTSAAEPVLLEALKDIVAIRSGSSFNAAIDRNGNAFCWGKNDSSQLGTGSTLTPDINSSENTPLPLEWPDDERVPLADIQCGHRHMVAIDKQGKSYTWGKKLYIVPQLIQGDNAAFLKVRISQIAAGQGFSAFVDSNGFLFTQGDGRHGTLGHGDLESTSQPVLVDGFGVNSTYGQVTAVFAGHKNIAVFASKQ